MKSTLKLALCTFACISVVTVSFADEAQDKAIKARQSLMQLLSFNLGHLGAMAKGDIAYDAKAAQAHADNLVTLARLDQSGLWVEGTDAEANPDKTRALKAIWDTYPKVAEKVEALQAGAEKMAAAAGSGVDGIKANMGAVGGACKGCHDDFRKPE